ncbi:ABC transporter substrate-binding protein [Poriferisphaera sp. WC338]|uniref:ABC transporter substrate-binding protein n=1 Tax=Poriferisphaera sp. WC338 TaxID=3425129 RepID=UPI003D814329
MENRFGLKDFIVIVLLVGIIVSIWLGIKAFDRQWSDVKATKTQVSQLTTEQARLRNELFAIQDRIDDLPSKISKQSAGVSSAQMQALLEQIAALQSTEKLTDAQLAELKQKQEALKTAALEQQSAAEASGETNTESIQQTDPFIRLKAAHDTPGFATGGTFIDAFATKVASLTPHVSSGTLYSTRVQEFVLQALLGRDPESLEMIPVLAKSWTVSDDGLIFTYKLRRNAVFSDGEPVTSADILYGWDLINNPEFDAPVDRFFYEPIESVAAPDEYTIVVKMKRPYYSSLNLSGSLIALPKHFYSKFSMKELNTRPGLLMGSGPYRMPDPENWAPGKLIELVRNERFWGPQPGFDRLIWREVSEDVARLTMFRNGEIDLFVSTSNPQQFENLQKEPEMQKKANFFSYNLIPSGYSFIAWNQNHNGSPTIFADKRVRQAMTYLTPRAAMAKEIFLGYSTVADGPFDNAGPQAAQDISPRPFDVAKGRAILAEAGWTLNKDNILENKDGEIFTFVFTYPASDKIYERISLFLKDAYAKAGIVMQPNPLEFSVMISRLNERDFEAIMLGWGGGAVEKDIRQIFHSSQMAASANNFISYNNPELDKLIDLARDTVNEEERMPIWQDCHRILYEDQPYTFMFRRKTLWIINNRVKNILPVTEGLNTRDEWFVPKAQQIQRY